MNIQNSKRPTPSSTFNTLLNWCIQGVPSILVISDPSSVSLRNRINMDQHGSTGPSSTFFNPLSISDCNFFSCAMGLSTSRGNPTAFGACWACSTTRVEPKTGPMSKLLQQVPLLRTSVHLSFISGSSWIILI